MSTKISSRPRKQRQKDDMKQEIVAQVHKPVRLDTSSDKDHINKSEPAEESSESNKTFIIEDKKENCHLRTPSRDISIDEEAQISTKIMSLIETEMKRDINKISHFTDSRPQSLSFYEDEKIPEELSGNLELLSPEERKHYKRRKEYVDLDLERNAYNTMQDTLIRESDEIIPNGTTKKSKSRKKKHATDNELGLGDSREMMIPKEKRKSKKKKRENSPMSSSSGKRKHRKRDDEYEPRNDITLALEELQDDVFENGPEDFGRQEKMRKSPRKSDKLYVQKKNKFEVVNRGDGRPELPHDETFGKRFSEYSPLELAVGIQKYWLPFTTLCHGLLGGIAFAHYCYFSSNYWSIDHDYIVLYGNYSDLYVCLFYLLNVICLISVFDRYDIAHLDLSHIKDLILCRKSCIVILIYLACLIVHLIAGKIDDKLSLVAYNNGTVANITSSELYEWNHLSFWRAILATIGWVIVALAPSEDLLYVHLKNMDKYATGDC